MKYWASASTSEIANHIIEKKDSYLNYLENSGILEELRKSYSLFFGNSAIDMIDNKTIMSVNHYGSLARSLHTLITQNRPALSARSINSDYKSQATTILANGLCDYYLREKNLEDHLKNACLLSLYLREGWITAEWDSQDGEIYGVNPESQTPIYAGEVEFNTYSILDIIRPLSGPQNYYIIRKTKNKFDLAAEYPELENEILATSFGYNEKKRWTLTYLNDTANGQDEVEVLVLYHAKTPALPQGRYVEICGGKVLIDSPLPYKKPYVFCIKSQDAFQTAFGHSSLMDLIPMQDALDTCFSTILSNFNSFGIGSLVTEKGTTSTRMLANGLMEIEVNPNARDPKILNLLQIPNEVFNFAQMLQSSQETISGINSVSRGNPPNHMSGVALALVANQALTFSSGLQQSYNKLAENIGSSLIELLQTYAVTPRVAQISGKTKKSFLREFKNTDLQGINRIVVETSNAFSKTQAGKVEIANNLLQTGLIKTPEAYIQVVETGTAEPLIEHEQSQLMLIRRENELLSEGQPVQALITDDDSLHVLEHSTILSDPEVRNDPQILQAALSHIQQHIENAKSKDPLLVQLLKQTPLQQPPQPMDPQALQQPQSVDLQSAQTPGMPTLPNGQEFDPTNSSSGLGV